MAFSGPALAEQAATDGEPDWIWLPLQLAAYDPRFSMSMVGGRLDSEAAPTGTINGFELAFNSPLLQPLNGGRIRQQISHTTYSGTSPIIASLEANPHYLIPLRYDFEVGFGPGVGLVDVGKLGKDRVYAVQLGTSLHYRNQDFVMGVELRAQWTETAKVQGRSIDADNTRLVFKVGFLL